MTETTPERRAFGALFPKPNGRVMARFRLDHRQHSKVFNTAPQAERWLSQQQAALDLGVFSAPVTKRTTFERLMELVESDYQMNGRRSLRRVKVCRLHLDPYFGSRRAAAITTDLITRYIVARQAEGAAASSIQKELSTLKRGFTLALRARLVTTRPYIPALTISNARSGFFEANEFEAVLAELPAALRPVMQFGYLTGWRVASEVLPLSWAQVDFRAGIVRLEPGTTKNAEGRTFPFAAHPALADLLLAQRGRVSALEKATGRILPHVFCDATGAPLPGYGAWKSACKRAGLRGKLVHDLRRTAVRNLVRAGVSEKTAMLLTGHKTRSVFDRYDIVSERDLADAVTKLATYGAAQPRAERKVVPLGR
jgi:integrase